ncbi:DgyrCDS10540 [Dimorphilus gyrociliatus]|uniref:Peroxisomal multifunctional enzyme type 2 n=1 Tax=Dimorphilus gyrociliatus TaxID=2664684 RepID=A0A7I8W0I4_9ANNE|nr:DgyrCDS10540 [Dimorphilus gyrociliatus]
MADQLRFDGKVVLVTGAGGGLGREYALEFARRGASVVVNDLGGDIKGGGKSSVAADKVVDEIRKAGGKAVANYDSVEDGEKVVQTALDHYGGIDIVVNNAGILRDRSFLRTSDADWDIVHRVHLRGAFKVTRAAWSHMREKKFGRVIMTSSDAGIFGNRGQANYSAAKLGLYGFSNTLAIEGAKNNIYCNTIAPTAGSRLTKTVMPDEVINVLKPEYVAPLVIYLCHESSQENGGLFEVGGGYVTKLRWQRAGGAVVRKKGVQMTAEQVRDCWNDIVDFETNPDYPVNISTDGAGRILSIIDQIENPEDPNAYPNPGGKGPEAAIGSKMRIENVELSTRDAMLYALSIGVSTTQENHLKFAYENSEDFSVIPTMSVCLAFPVMPGIMKSDAVSIDYTQLLHGEQYTECFKPLKSDEKYSIEGELVDVLDKGKGAIFITEAKMFDKNEELVSLNQFTTFVRGAGGFGGKRDSTVAKQPLPTPDRQPDAVVSEKTSLDQAALYRLSGDYNPLHIDPNFSAMGGFEKPILHGLCSYGFAARAVLNKFCNDDVAKFKAMKVRFSKPVLPGQTLQTEMWLEGDKVHFCTKIGETGQVCLSNGYVILNKDDRLAKL